MTDRDRELANNLIDNLISWDATISTSDVKWFSDQILATIATVRRETWEEAAKVIENEPELPEEMPLEARIALTDLPLEEQQRAAVRATKKCLAKACRDKARGAA